MAISLVISVALGAMPAQARGVPREEPERDRDRDATVPGRIGPALEKRIRGRASLDDVRVEVSWPLESGLSSARVYGNGVGIWDRKVQFRLSKAQVVSILKTLQKERFASMPERFGEVEEEEEKKDKNEGPRLKGRIEVRVGPIAKTVSQMMDGEQSEELESLAKRLLAICEGPARTGVGAASLADGLQKVVARVLAPETLQVTVQRRPDAPTGGTPGGRWILRLEGRRVLDEFFPGGQPPLSRKVLVLSEADFQSLVKQLADHHPDTIPINVFAPEYIDIHLAIFRWSRSLSARSTLAFAGAVPGYKRGDLPRRRD